MGHIESHGTCCALDTSGAVDSRRKRMVAAFVDKLKRNETTEISQFFRLKWHYSILWLKNGNDINGSIRK